MIAPGAAVLAAALFSAVSLTGCEDSERADRAASAAVAARPSSPGTKILNDIRIGSEEHVITVRLDDSAVARAFAAMLPLTLDIEDFHDTEKIAYLPERLAVAQEPKGVTPRAGDLAYYGPWGNIALFYRDFVYSPGLVRLGTVTSASEPIVGLTGRVRIAVE